MAKGKNEKLASHVDRLKDTAFVRVEQAKKVLADQGLKDIFAVPDSVAQNIKHPMRPYQQAAFENFLLANPANGAPLPSLSVDDRCHLFHMATGAGKTLLMAASILHLHSLGYRKFIFLTNQVNLINKTRQNLLPGLRSKKCEFKERIEINGVKTNVVEARHGFGGGSASIEIMFCTINGLHDDVNDQRENAITLDSMKHHKIAILADEAHHFNASTKTGKGEADEEKSWENTIKALLNVNKDNRLVEFTATMDLLNDSVFEKYKDRLVYDYTLARFREDGYSKDISLVQIAADKIERALVAIFVSQFRQDLAQEHGIPLVPRILFKCQGKIDDLEKERTAVLSAIAGLTPASAKALLASHRSASSVVGCILAVYAGGLNFERFFNRVAMNFCERNSRVIHSKNSPVEKAVKMEELNAIDASQTIRMVFAINILNEGWDVLSLFDIVKMDEMSSTSKTTTSEVQLIGRGARIFPYSWKDSTRDYDPFRRKFDGDICNPLRDLESMSFYSASDNLYIESLRNGLIESGLTESSHTAKANISSRVEKQGALSAFAKRMYLSGEVISNGSVEEYTTFRKLCDFQLKYDRVWDEADRQTLLADPAGNAAAAKTISETLFISELVTGYPHLTIKALHKIAAWSVDSAHALLPAIASEKDILKELQGLGSSVAIKVVGKTFADVPYGRKIEMLVDLLSSLASQMAKKRLKRVGKKTFEYVQKIADAFKGYSKDADKVSPYGIHPIKGKDAIGNPVAKAFAITNSKLFYYDHVSWDSGLELEMYRLFDENLNENECLVIRNEVGFKLYGTEGESDGEGFEPDFIVLRQGKDAVYQYFIEVKGEGMKSSDENSWKQSLLLSLETVDPVVSNGTTYKLVGLPFFTENTIASGQAKQYAQRLKAA